MSPAPTVAAAMKTTTAKTTAMATAKARAPAG